jgi:tetratricopeptide (TPR) repeat protein
MKDNNFNPEIAPSTTFAGAAGGSKKGSVPHALVPRWLALSFLILAMLVAAGVRFRLLDFPLERDEGEYAYAGQLIQEGIPPYQLAYNMKMPGIYLAYAAIMWLFGQTTAAIHLGLLLVNLATAAVLFLVARKWLDIAGATVAASGYVLMTLSPAYLGLAAHATQFVILAALLGFWLLFRVENEERLPGCLAAGCLFGVAFLMKQQGLFFGVFGGLYLAWISLAGKMAWGRVWPRLAWYALGCLLPFLAVCLWLKLAGAFPAFWFWTFSYAREYVGILSVHDGIGRAKTAFVPMFHAAPLLWASAGAGLEFLWLARQPRNVRGFFGGLLLFSFLAVCPGWYFRQHYFIVFVPTVALLAGLAVSWSGQWLAKIGSSPLMCRLPFFFGMAACVQSLFADRAVLFFLPPDAACRVVYPANPFPESPGIARYLEQHTSKDQRIVVLGSEPQIYFFAHRHSSTGYIYIYPLMEAQPFAPAMQEAMIREIQQNPPAYLILVSNSESWEVQPGSSSRLIDWLAGYLNQDMEQVGLVRPVDKLRTETIWGPEAATVPLNSDSYIAIFKRVETASASDRSHAIARNKVLMDTLYDRPLNDAIRLKPDDIEAREKLAFALFQLGRMDEAAGEFQEIARRAPGDSDAHNNLAMALASGGRIDEAIVQFREALRLKPNNPVIHNNLGNVLAQAGQGNEAISEFREALRLRPEYARAHGNLGMALVKLGRDDEAIGEFKEALRIDPNDSAARDCLAKVGGMNKQKP